MTITRKPVAERFWAKVVKRGAEDCWVWSGNTSSCGYGRLRLGGKNDPQVSTHRFSYELANGPIEGGLYVLHRCDNRACVNPGHLFLGTAKDNIDDCLSKGRGGGQFSTGHDPRRVPKPKKLTTEQVLSIRRDDRQHRTIAADYGVDRSLISHIKRRKTWAHV